MRALTGFILFVIFHISLLTGCEQNKKYSNSQPASGKTVKIGVIGTFSGKMKPRLTQGLSGIKTALSLNPRLENGDTIELIVKDDNSSADRAVEALKELSQEGAAAVLSLSNSKIVLALVEPSKTFELPILAVYATHPDVTASEYISQLIFDDNIQGKVAAMFTRDELLFDRAAVFYNPDNPHSSHLADQFILTFESVGGIITGYENPQATNELNLSILERLQSLDTELIYMPIRAEYVVSLAESANELEWTPQGMGSDGLLSDIILLHSDKLRLVDGLIALDIVSSGMPTSKYGNQIVSEYKKLFQDKGTTFAVLGIEGTKVIQQALNKCIPSLEPYCINSWIRKTENMQGVFSQFSINSEGKAIRPVFINAIKRDKMIFKVMVF